MKTKWLWIVGAAALVVVAVLGVLGAGAGTSRKASVLSVVRTQDPNGQFHIVYEITNTTSGTIELELISLETHHKRTGWWEVYGWPTSWHIDKTAGRARGIKSVTLHQFSSAKLDVLPPQFHREGVALRGKLQQIQVDSPAAKRLRRLANRLHLTVPGLVVPRPVLVDLSAVELPMASGPTRVPGPVPALVAAPAQMPSPVDGVAGNAMGSQSPVSGSEMILPAGCIRFVEADLRTVLGIYAELANAQLEIDSPVRKLATRITVENTQAVTRSQAVELLEKALREQAGVNVKPLGANRISVGCGNLTQKPGPTR